MATFTRNSVAYKSDGTSVTANQPRFENGGVTVEEGTTNLQDTEPTSLTDIPVKSNVIWNNGVYFGNNSVLRYVIEAKTLTANTAYTFSVDIKMDDGSEPKPGTNTSSYDFALVIDNLICSSHKVEYYKGNGVYRVSGTRTSAATPQNGYGIYKYTTQTSKGFTVVGNWQFEQKPYATSKIPPGQTRAAEVLTGDTAGDVNEVVFKLSRSPGTNQQYIFDGNGAVNQSVRVYIKTDGRPEMVYGTGIAEVTITGVSALVKDTDYSIGFAADVSGGRLLINGVQVASSATAASVTFGANVYWGSKADGTLQLDGQIKDLRCSVFRSNAEILADYQTYTLNNKPLPLDQYATLAMPLDYNLREIRHLAEVVTVSCIERKTAVSYKERPTKVEVIA